LHAYYIGSSTDESSSVCVGSSATLKCNFTATSAIVNVVWRKESDGIVITDSTPGYTVIQTQSSSTQVATGLVVHNTTLGDNGTAYTCSATIAAMELSRTMVLNVVGGMYA